MARIRTIKPEFFRKEKLYDAEVESGLPLRLAFAGLWTAADREGRFAWKPRTLKLDCLPHDDVDFSEIMDALWAIGCIQKYEVNGKQYGFVPSWHEHQHINQREAQSSLPEPTDECMCTHVQARGERKGKEGKGTDIPTRADAPRRPADEDFEKFKKVYPSRGPASNPWKPAREVYDRHVKAGEDPDGLVVAAEIYARKCAEQKISGTDKVAQAVTWLRQERFRDYFDGMEAELSRRKEAEDDMARRGYAWDGQQWRKKDDAA